MVSKILTFVDAAILIYAATKPSSLTFARRARALQVLTDPDRDFIATEYLQLEVMPIAKYYGKTKEIVFYETFFSAVQSWIDCATLVTPAYNLACQYGLGAMDALHIVAAASVNAEFVTAEKPTKPIYRAYANITSVY